MDENTYYREILAINSANLAANIENVSINEKLLSLKSKDDVIISLLTQILEVLKNDSSRNLRKDK
jgi:hypothetical protein